LLQCVVSRWFICNFFDENFTVKPTVTRCNVLLVVGLFVTPLWLSGMVGGRGVLQCVVSHWFRCNSGVKKHGESKRFRVAMCC